MPEIVELADVPALVPGGATLAVGGMTLYRRPVALVRELLRSGVGDLELIAFTGGFETDLLLGAGRVRRLRSCYVGLETLGLAPMFTALGGGGAFELVEETEATIGLGLRAALGRVDFLPHPGILGTDIPRLRPDLRTVRSPYSDAEYLAIPPLRPEVALLHAPRADRQGNVHLGGNLAVDREIASLATTTVVSVEELVDELGRFEADLLGTEVTHLVLAPGGARPTSCFPLYGLQATRLLEYQAAAGLGMFEEYLEAFLDPGLPLEEIPARLGVEVPGVSEATVAETMVFAMSRELAGERLVVQGIATPLVTAALVLARRTCAPGLSFGYAIGNSFGSRVGPVSLVDPEALTLGSAVARFGFVEAAGEFLPHANPFEFFRPAQVDPSGATNNLVIGDPASPRLRLPGSAGIPDVSPTSQSARLYVPRHTPRVFVERLDLCSGAGFVEGRHPGPVRVFTNLATLVLREGRLGVERLMPGVDLGEVREATGFELAPGPAPGELPRPDAEILRLLREEVDPLGMRDLDFLSTRERFLALYRMARREEASRDGGAPPATPGDA